MEPHTSRSQECRGASYYKIRCFNTCCSPFHAVAEMDGLLRTDVNTSTVDSGNETLTCLARNIQGPVELPLFPPLLPLVSRCLLVIYYMLTAFYGTLFNGLVVYLVCKYKQLRTLDFVFALQIAVSNIIGTVILLSGQFSSVLLNQWRLGEPICAILGILNLFVPCSRTLLLLCFVINRSCNIFFAYSYPKYRTKVASGLMIAVYLISVVLSTIPVAIDCFSFSVTGWTCRLTSSCNSLCMAYQLFLGFTVYIPSSIASVIMYSALFRKGWKARKGLPVAANDLTGDRKMINKEWRATITFFLMFASIFIFVVPGILLLLATRTAGVLTNSEESLWFYILDGLTVNSFAIIHIADPCFILRNRDVREVFSKINWIPRFGNRL